MVVLATIATVIASQAVISGAFSVTRQAVQLGFLPRLTILHTSREAGQVYVPAVNWGIFVAVVALVVGFGSSAAPGRRPTGSRSPARWRSTPSCSSSSCACCGRSRPWVALAGGGFFLLVDLTFFSANLPKVLHGGWFPLVIALVIFVVLTTWQRGREIVTAEARGARRAAGGLHRGDPRSRAADRALAAHRHLPRRQSARRRRSRCAPTSSTTACCTRASSSCRCRRSTSRTSRTPSA